MQTTHIYKTYVFSGFFFSSKINLNLGNQIKCNKIFPYLKMGISNLKIKVNIFVRPSYNIHNFWCIFLSTPVFRFMFFTAAINWPSGYIYVSRTCKMPIRDVRLLCTSWSTVSISFVVSSPAKTDLAVLPHRSGCVSYSVEYANVICVVAVAVIHSAVNDTCSLSDAFAFVFCCTSGSALLRCLTYGLLHARIFPFFHGLENLTLL